MRRFVTLVLTGSFTLLVAAGCSSTPDPSESTASTAQAQDIGPKDLCEAILTSPTVSGTVVPFTTTYDGTFYAVVNSTYTTILETAATATTSVPVVYAKVTPPDTGNCDVVPPGGVPIIDFTPADVSLIVNAAQTYNEAHESKNQQCESAVGVPYCAMCGCCMGGACPTTTKGCTPNRCQ